MSQHFSPWTQAWGETLGEEVGEALSFPRLETRHPRGGWGKKRVRRMRSGGGVSGGGQGWEHNYSIHVHVHITEFICVN